jgi:cardiolipin synthase
VSLRVSQRPRDSPGKPAARRPRCATGASDRTLAEHAFSRAAGAPLVHGNAVRLLRDARENYPAWLDAIRGAERYILFESYIVHEDDVGREFADALIAKARDGIRVRLVYDWMGALGKTSRRFWNRLRAGGVQVRCYNPPRLGSAFGWLSRDHRKMLSVDGRVGFVTGLCVGRMWVGMPEAGVDPWRDTGIEVRGPSVADVETAFAQMWALMGEPILDGELAGRDAAGRAGDAAVRVVATVPATAALYRLDQLVAALATERVWLTDAYYAATTAYVQALCEAAKDGVDVRLLVPNATDIPLLRPVSRAGYRPLLAAGVRVFEWNGTMLHAKTAVADARWARVGSSNLNVASWLGNCELDAVIEDEPFARRMEEAYLQDLAHATEIVLDTRARVRAPGEPRHARPALGSGGGSAGRAAAGAIRVGRTIGAAFTNQRVLEPVEARVMAAAGLVLIAFAIVVVRFPRVLVYPVALLSAWIAVTLLYRAVTLHRAGRPSRRGDDP